MLELLTVDHHGRKYTLERMFTNLLLESAKDELSFRTVVRDLQTKQPMLQIVLLNPNSWCCAGYCLGTVEQVPKVNMYPTIKLLFSDCSKSNECQLRLVDCSLCILVETFHSLLSRIN